MTQKQKEIIMTVAAKDNDTVSENLSVATMSAVIKRNLDW